MNIFFNSLLVCLCVIFSFPTLQPTYVVIKNPYLYFSVNGFSSLEGPSSGPPSLAESSFASLADTTLPGTLPPLPGFPAAAAAAPSVVGLPGAGMLPPLGMMMPPLFGAALPPFMDARPPPLGRMSPPSRDRYGTGTYCTHMDVYCLVGSFR